MVFKRYEEAISRRQQSMNRVEGNTENCLPINCQWEAIIKIVWSLIRGITMTGFLSTWYRCILCDVEIINYWGKAGRSKFRGHDPHPVFVVGHAGKSTLKCFLSSLSTWSTVWFLFNQILERPSESKTSSKQVDNELVNVFRLDKTQTFD